MGKRHLRLYWLAVVLAFAATAPAALISTPFRASVQNLLFDQFQRWRPRTDSGDAPVRVIAIDDESIRKLGPWPWPRPRVAMLITALTRAKVAAIGVDIVFSEPEVGDGDAALAHAIADQPVVLGDFLTDATAGGAVPIRAGFASAGDDPLQFVHRSASLIAPPPDLERSASGVGFVNWLPERDGVLRRVPLILGVDGQLHPSLAMETLRIAQGASTYVIKSSNASGESAFGAHTGVNSIKNGDATIATDNGGELRVYFAQERPARTIPAWKVLEEGADLADLAGDIVFVGVSASLLSDVVTTPLREAAPGVDTHAQIIEQILGGATLRRPDWAPGAEFLLTVVTAAALAFALPIASALWCAVLGGLEAGGGAYISWYAFSRHGLLLDPMLPILSSSAVFLAGVLALYGLGRSRESEIRSAFGRYVSPAVVARLVDNPDALNLGGLQRELTLMFCDLRSFTTLSEGFSAVELTRFLNEYLTPMTDAVLEARGAVDKYMGDAIMAFWNAPLDDPKHAPHAVAAALRMRALLAELNAEWRSRAEAGGKPFATVKFGIGLNTGECCVGNLGSIRRFDYSAIGDAVNVASRLDGASKFFGVDIVASDSTRAAASEFAWLEIDRVRLKNKTHPIGVHALVGDPSLAMSVEFRALARTHEAMLTAYRERRFAYARARAADAAEQAPRGTLDGLYAYYERRFADLAAEPPDLDWRAMVELDEK